MSMFEVSKNDDEEHLLLKIIWLYMVLVSSPPWLTLTNNDEKLSIRKSLKQAETSVFVDFKSEESL